MNTRLQVEHPVTEAITGQDLVEWQIRVARGENLPRRQDQLAIQGWAIEARLYAEDPARDFLPSIGRLDHLRLPDGIRVDTGVDQGDTIPPFYDPMIAKLIAHGTDRAEAIARLASACDQIQCAPVQTNGWFLRRLLDMESYRAGEMTTGSIAQGAEALCRAPVPGDGLLQAAAWRAVGALDLPGFRLNAPRDRRVRLAVNGALHTVVLGARPPAHDSALFFEGGMGFATAPWAVRGGASGVSDGALLAPMPGMVVARDVALGDRVTRGQRIVVIEAMKMEQALLAPFDGVVAMVGPAPGAQVTEGALLARIEPEETQS
jgi:3-methylcrotonyl-CoA carboxylase alpha subunit